MTEQPKDGGPAFPTQRKTGVAFAGDDRMLHAETLQQGGMSLRDWFAGQALAGLGATFLDGGWHNPTDYQLGRLAEGAYRAADAMLEARK